MGACRQSQVSREILSARNSHRRELYCLRHDALTLWRTHSCDRIRESLLNSMLPERHQHGIVRILRPQRECVAGKTVRSILTRQRERLRETFMNVVIAPVGIEDLGRI